eukprot:752437-Hanusia_phi.AAC.2
MKHKVLSIPSYLPVAVFICTAGAARRRGARRTELPSLREDAEGVCAPWRELCRRMRGLGPAGAKAAAPAMAAHSRNARMAG